MSSLAKSVFLHTAIAVLPFEKVIFSVWCSERGKGVPGAEKRPNLSSHYVGIWEVVVVVVGEGNCRVRSQVETLENHSDKNVLTFFRQSREVPVVNTMNYLVSGD